MEIKMPDGNVVTLAGLKADVAAAQEKFVSGEFCFTWPTMLGVLNKLDELNPEKTFTLFWLSGQSQLVVGRSINQACANVGIGGGAMRTLDWWAHGDARAEYVWNIGKRKWCAVHNPEGL